jgi:RNA polymerase sigma factor (sigma-70 family)
VHDSDVSVPAVPGASIPGVADDAAILNEAYDSYADALYAYCRSLVQEPAAAADAVRDAFVVAAFRLADVPHESLLRPWLFAVARNECLRAITSAAATGARSIFPDGDEAAPADSVTAAPGDAAASAPDSPGDAAASGDPDDAQARALPRAALGGLGAVERDFILMAWHGLDIAECADVLGITRDEAFKLFARARDQLEASAGVLVVAGSDWRECAALNTLIAGWDGRLTPALRPELRQHIDRCDICADQRRQGLRPSVLLSMSPDAMRGLATTPGTLRRAAWVTSRLKDRVLAAAFDQELDSFEHRAMAVRRAAPFRDDGFPVPLDPPGAAPRGKQRSRIPLALVGLTGAGLAAVLVVVAVTLSSQHSTGSAALPTQMSLSQPSTSSSGTAPSAEASSSGQATPQASKTPTARASSASPSASSATPTPTGKSSTSAPASPTPSKPPAPAGPKVGVSPASVTLNWYPQYGAYGGSITLTNTTSGTLSWSITLPSDLHIGGFNAQSSGTLSPGQKVVVIIYARHNGNRQGNGSRTETVTLHPGNVQVAVTIPGH